MLQDKIIKALHFLRVLTITNGNRVGVLWNPLFWLLLILYAVIGGIVQGHVRCYLVIRDTIVYNVYFSIEQKFILKRKIVSGAATIKDGKEVLDSRTFTEKLNSRMRVAK